MNLETAAKQYYSLINDFIKSVETEIKEQEPSVSSVLLNDKNTSKGTHMEVQVIFVFNGKKEVVKREFAYTDIVSQKPEMVATMLQRIVEKHVQVLTSSLSEKEQERLEMANSKIDWAEAA